LDSYIAKTLGTITTLSSINIRLIKAWQNAGLYKWIRHTNKQESCAIAKMTARCVLYKKIVSRCGDMAIRNYPRWRRPPSWICSNRK